MAYYNKIGLLILNENQTKFLICEPGEKYLEKILNVVINRMARVGARKTKAYPAMQINNLDAVKAIDKYIKTKSKR